MLHAIGGLAAASFYIPYKRVQELVLGDLLARGRRLQLDRRALGGVAGHPPADPRDPPRRRARATLFWTFFFGVLWGVGGLTFGLTMRYLGIALGYAIALGLCAAFGTLMPPLFQGQLGEILVAGLRAGRRARGARSASPASR